MTVVQVQLSMRGAQRTRPGGCKVAQTLKLFCRPIFSTRLWSFFQQDSARKTLLESAVKHRSAEEDSRREAELRTKAGIARARDRTEGRHEGKSPRRQRGTGMPSHGAVRQEASSSRDWPTGPSKQDIKIIGGDVYPNRALKQDVKITAVVNFFDQDIKIWATKMAQQAKALVRAWKSEFNPWNPREDTRREPTP